MISCPPFPSEGFNEAHKFQVNDLISLAEKHEPGFAERHGIELDNGQLPLGKLKHQELIKRVWPDLPQAAKVEFLETQFGRAVNYLVACALAFEKAGCEIPEKVEQATNRLLS